MNQQLTARLWNNDEKHWAECAREKGLFSAMQGVIRKCDSLLPFSRAQTTRRRGKKSEEGKKNGERPERLLLGPLVNSIN